MSGSNAPDQNAQAMMRYDANKRSPLVAYLLWFFLGYLGAHRFYLKYTGSGAAMLVISIISFFLTFVLVGVVGFFAIGIWWLVDAFLIPGMARDYNNHLITTISA